jgi:hypothetical protein
MAFVPPRVSLEMCAPIWKRSRAVIFPEAFPFADAFLTAAYKYCTEEKDNAVPVLRYLSTMP